VHTNNTITGINIIRSSNSEKNFIKEFKKQIDYHTRAAVSFTFINRWFAMRVDW
jgi:hypothetical protein